MWVFLALASIVTAVLNLVQWARGQETKYFRFASISLTALTMCAFYGDSAKRVIKEDWSGLMDIMPGMSGTLWICVIASLLINGITLLAKAKRGYEKEE